MLEVTTLPFFLYFYVEIKEKNMEELKKCVCRLLETKEDHLPLLQHINELILKNYCISAGGYLTLIPKDVEIYYVNRHSIPPCVDTNMQCMLDPKTNDEIRRLQSGRFGQLYFHRKGSGGIDICLSDSPDYALCCTLRAAEVNGEELWSAQRVRNRLVDIICQHEGLADRTAVQEWMNRVHSLPMLRRRELPQTGECWHLRRKGLRHRDKLSSLPLRSVLDLWNKGLDINHVQKLMIYMDRHPEADVLEVLRQQQFRYIPSEIRIRYGLDKKVKLYES